MGNARSLSGRESFSSMPTEELLRCVQEQLNVKLKIIQGMQEEPLTKYIRTELCRLTRDLEKYMYDFNIDMNFTRNLPKYGPDETETDKQTSEDQSMELQKMKKGMLELLEMKNTLKRQNVKLEARVNQLQEQNGVAIAKNELYQKRIQKLEKENGDEKENIASLESEVQELQNQYEEQNKTLDTLVSELHSKNVMSRENEEELQTHINQLRRETEREESRLKKHIKQLEGQVNTSKSDRSSLDTHVDRRPYHMFRERGHQLEARGHHLQAQTSARTFAAATTSAISDLRDPNQPLDLEVIYEDIYQNEWSDAFQHLLDSGYAEEEATKALKLFLQEAVRFCEHDIRPFIGKTVKELQLLFEMFWKAKTFAKSLNAQVSSDEEDSADSYGMVSGRRKRSPDTDSKQDDKEKEIGLTLAHFAQKRFQEATFGVEYIPGLKPFIVKCLYFGWLIAVQSPPAVLHDCSGDTKFDIDLYKEYKSSGPLLKFVVWPPLLQYKNGPVLAKGYAEGKQRQQEHKELYLQR